jgi:hypothetical protein
VASAHTVPSCACRLPTGLRRALRPPGTAAGAGAGARQRALGCAAAGRRSRTGATVRPGARAPTRGASARRFDYSQDFLKWALQPPGTRGEWVLGVRVAASGRLVGFITAVPARVRVRAAGLAMVEINYLCVHKKLRAKRLAPVLIKARPRAATAGQPAQQPRPTFLLFTIYTVYTYCQNRAVQRVGCALPAARLSLLQAQRLQARLLLWWGSWRLGVAPSLIYTLFSLLAARHSSGCAGSARGGKPCDEAPTAAGRALARRRSRGA